MKRFFFTAVVFGLVITGATKASAQQAAAAPVTAEDVAKLINASDAHFAAVGAAQISPVDLLKAWEAESAREAQILPIVNAQPASAIQVKFARRDGVTKLHLSKGKGSEAADAAFTKSLVVLEGIGAAGVGGDDMYEQMFATIWKEQADNLVLLSDAVAAQAVEEEKQGHADKVQPLVQQAQARVQKAQSLLETALTAARKSRMTAGKLGEATILERLAGIHFRAERFKDTLKYASDAVAIMDPMAQDPSFNRENLRFAIWYVAVSKSREKQDALADFNKFAILVGRDITPHDEGDLYREAAVNVGEQGQRTYDLAVQKAQALAGEAKTKAIADAAKSRLESRKLAHSFILKARQVIDKSTASDADDPEKLAIYTDLAMSYSRGGMAAESDNAFQEAIAVGIKSKSPFLGPNSAALIPTRLRYAALLRGMNLPDATKKQDDEVARLRQVNGLPADTGAPATPNASPQSAPKK